MSLFTADSYVTIFSSLDVASLLFRLKGSFSTLFQSVFYAQLASKAAWKYLHGCAGLGPRAQYAAWPCAQHCCCARVHERFFLNLS